MTDDYFGALGGSLMKDLLADLQVDEGDDLFSLDQLEKELASMDHGPPLDQAPPPLFGGGGGGPVGLTLPPLNAASLVNAHAQERSTAAGDSTTAAQPPPPGADAWSLSLQNFTSLSLQEDFLAADSARKKNHQQPAPQLDGAEEYDVKEKLSIAPPPGMVGGVVPPAPPVDEPDIPPKHRLPKTPQNSMSIPHGSDASEADETRREAILSAVQAEASKAAAAAAPGQPQPSTQKAPSAPVDETPVPPPATSTAPPPSHPPQSAQQPHQQPQGFYPPGGPPPQQFPPGGPPTMGPPPVMATMVPPGAVPMGVPMPFPMGQPMPPQMGMAMPPHPPGPGVVMGAPVSTSGPAWQTPNRMVPPPQMALPQQQQQQQQQQQLQQHSRPAPPKKVFCNPSPNAPPVPAAALESSYMSARDIAFVVHGILKPVLSAGVSEEDYYLQFIRRRGGPSANPVNPKRVLDLDKEMSSRESKAKEWASEKATLGYVAKANVARPRALIATPKPTADPEETEDKKQRATLWKARVYCDQAYQAYQRVVEIWRMAPPGSVPPQVQVHLAKLMKCMGIALDENKGFTVDIEPLKLLTKLGKGRTLVARVLEQALLPPNAVQALIPNLSDVIMSLQPDPTTDRVSRAIGSIIVKLPSITSDTLISCLEVAVKHGKSSISTPTRIECAHALLSKGTQVVSQDPSDEKKTAWKTSESQFMAML
mmetsp:Transcript_53465/g.130167  ORF Transcript_53465/g.130167 Transcript_53465/m.130167 type:complete len:707 (-) Transcript_53465:135-2255(-)